VHQARAARAPLHDNARSSVHASGHHTSQDLAVLVIVKPRRWRSARAFRTAAGIDDDCARRMVPALT